MLQEYNFLSEIGDILSIYYDGLDDAFFVSNAKSLIREQLGTNSEIAISMKDMSKKVNDNEKENELVYLKDDDIITLRGKDLTYHYTLTESKVTSAERTKFTISCITETSEREYWTSDEEDGENGSEQENDEEKNQSRKELEEEHKKYLDAVDKQRNSFIDVTEGVFRISSDIKNEKRVNLIDSINRVIDDMVKDAKICSTNQDIVKNYSHAEYNVKDFHPGSNDVVLDIVHPSLFPYIRNKTDLIQEGKTANQFDREVQNSKKQKMNQNKTGEKTSGDDNVDDSENDDIDEEFDMWGRRYESSNYQWLPAEFHVDDKGKVSIKSKINNLPTNHENKMVKLIEELFEECVPELNKCYNFCKDIKFPSGDVGEDEEHKKGVQFKKPLKKCLYGETLQVITKIVEYELQPGQVHPDGAWHVEGMSHENIICTAVTVLKKDPLLRGGGLRFKRAFTGEEACEKIFFGVPQCRQKWVEDVIEEGIIELGRCNTNMYETVVFPNSHIHQLSEIKNHCTEMTRTRRVIVFWLINPNKRIISTADIKDCSNEKIGILEALKHRLKLMEERKKYKQDWNIREISLCEH